MGPTTTGAWLSVQPIEVRLFILFVAGTLVGCGPRRGLAPNADSCPSDAELVTVDEQTACVAAWSDEHPGNCPGPRDDGYIHYDVLICADTPELSNAELDALRDAYLVLHPDTKARTTNPVCPPVDDLALAQTFTACGLTYHVLGPPASDGWTSVSYTRPHEPAYPFSFPWLTEGSSGGLVFENRGSASGLLAVDTQGVPTAWWTTRTSGYDEAGNANLHVRADAAGSTVAITTEDGVSVLDWDGTVPTERYCIEARYPAATLNGKWLVVTIRDGDEGEGAYADVYSVTDSTSVARVEVNGEGVAVLDQDRLLARRHNGDLVLYEIEASGVSELARGPDPGVGEFPTERSGFAFNESESGYVGVDMRSGKVDAYTLVPDSENPCVLEVTQDADPTNRVWIVANRFRATESERFVTREEAISVACPTPNRPFSELNFARVAAREPDGTRVVFVNGLGDERTIIDLQTDAYVAAFPFLAQTNHIFWVGDTIAVIYRDEQDYGIPIRSWIDFHTEMGDSFAPPERVDLPGPLVSAAEGGGYVWVLAEPTGRDFGDAAPAASSLLLSRIPFAGPHGLQSVSLPAGFAALGVAANADSAWVHGEMGRLLRVDSDLTVTELPGMLPTTKLYRSTGGDLSSWGALDAVAGSFGFIGLDREGRLWWAPQDGDRVLPHEEPCLEYLPMAANGADLYLRARRPGGVGISSWYQVEHVTLTAGPGSFTTSTQSKLPAHREVSILPGGVASEVLVLTPGLPVVTP